jgi:hypothetical protein
VTKVNKFRTGNIPETLELLLSQAHNVARFVRNFVVVKGAAVELFAGKPHVATGEKGICFRAKYRTPVYCVVVALDEVWIWDLKSYFF